MTQGLRLLREAVLRGGTGTGRVVFAHDLRETPAGVLPMRIALQNIEQPRLVMRLKRSTLLPAQRHRGVYT